METETLGWRSNRGKKVEKETVGQDGERDAC